MKEKKRKVLYSLFVEQQSWFMVLSVNADVTITNKSPRLSSLTEEFKTGVPDR